MRMWVQDHQARAARSRGDWLTNLAWPRLEAGLALGVRRFGVRVRRERGSRRGNSRQTVIDLGGSKRDRHRVPALGVRRFEESAARGRQRP